MRVLRHMEKEFSVVIARGICNGVSREDAHEIVDKLYNQYFSHEI